MPRRAKVLFDFDNPEPTQGRLFLNPSVDDGPPALKFFPPVYRDYEGFMQVFEDSLRESMTGLDLEFSTKTKRPTIIGVASKKHCAAVKWTDELATQVIQRSRILSGHAVTDADREVVHHRLGIQTPVRKWSDSMIRHYICNQDFCAAPGKDEDEDDGTALGLMNLWAMASVTTYLPQWKECRGSACLGPCPKHDAFGYCAVDSWAGLKGDYYYQKFMEKNHIPNKLYEDLQDLTVYCHRMHEQGVCVDRQIVKRLEDAINNKKYELFPYETKGKKKIFGAGTVTTELSSDTEVRELGAFNPASGDQILDYFSGFGIAILGKGNKPATDKDAIRNTLLRELAKQGVDYEVDDKSGVLSIAEHEIDDLPEPLVNLYKLDEWKNAGKGLSSWFGDKYIRLYDGNNPLRPEKFEVAPGDWQLQYGFAYPRFIVTGTSTGRLASSGPNFQNIPRLGFGVEVRKAIVPRHPKLKLIKADKSQLEFRIVMFYADITLPDGVDAFNMLVENSNGQLKEAAATKGCKERDIAKSIAHAADYMEGLMVLNDYDLRSAHRQKEIKAGALLVCDGKQGRPLWIYRGGYVCFTGANLAQRLFKSKDFANRKKALAIQEYYFSQFPGIRRWQQQVSEQIERCGFIQSHTGRFLELYGTAEDDLKLACAFLGQGGGADEVQEGMLRFLYLDRIALLQVHDELVFEVPVEMNDDECTRYFDPMCEPSKRFDNRVYPIEISVGPTWYKKDLKVIYPKAA